MNNTIDKPTDLVNRLGAFREEAFQEAVRQKQNYLGVEHVFVALLRRPGGMTESLVRGLGLNPVAVRDAIRREAGTGRHENAVALQPSPRLFNLLRNLNGGDTGESAWLRALLEEGESMPVRYLRAFGHSIESLLARLEQPKTSDADGTRLSGGQENADATRLSSAMGANPVVPAALATVAGPAITPRKEELPVTLPTPNLDLFGRDLAKAARMGKLADAIGREREIEQMITILARTQKSNPLLLGEAGVGKTAIIEGLALRIAEGRVPAVLQGKRVVELDMGSLTAGTNLRGQFEERINKIVHEATETKEVILFIDEIHTLMGAGGQGSRDAAQMLKPPLARGDISCIGATTQDEYDQHIRKDPALERRFTPVIIAELDAEATLTVLRKVAGRIVAQHAGSGQNLDIAPEALRAAVTLTGQYVKNRHQPDKSIDALDMACARAVVQGQAKVGVDDLAFVVSEWTGIPAERLTREELARYATMEQALRQKVVGQDEAVSAVSRRLRSALAGLKADNRPIGVFLFMGPSGVGKTKLAKELATFLFDTPDALIRFDMNQYHDAHTVANLIGSARGYVGSESGGQFTEALRRRPYSVVLLDEIEKAHPDIFNVFLPVFDDGHITDNRGRMVDCANAVFILTSNIGAGEVDFQHTSRDELRLMAERFMRPELVNRINDVIGFQPLKLDHLAAILDHLLAEKAAGFLKGQNIVLTVDDAVKLMILDSSYDARMGARPLERAVDEMIVQPLVDAIFNGQLTGRQVRAVMELMKIVFKSGQE